MVLDAARDPESPIHDGFEWDDTKAAEEFRLTQARLIIRSLRIEILTDEEEEPAEIQRIYWSTDDEESRYVNVKVLLEDDALYQQALERATRLLKGVRDRFNEIKELESIWAAIDAL